MVTFTTWLVLKSVAVSIFSVWFISIIIPFSFSSLALIFSPIPIVSPLSDTVLQPLPNNGEVCKTVPLLGSVWSPLVLVFFIVGTINTLQHYS